MSLSRYFPILSEWAGFQRPFFAEYLARSLLPSWDPMSAAAMSQESRLVSLFGGDAVKVPSFAEDFDSLSIAPRTLAGGPSGYLLEV